MTDKKKEVVVKQEEGKPIPVEILATNIIAISEGMKKSLQAGLKKEAIVVLIQSACASRVSKADIRDILWALENLRSIYCTK